jgi:hypothetical protein
MNSWKHLPVEILNLVFDEVASCNYEVSKNLCQCQLVCKKWSEAAQRHLYKSVSIRKHESFMKLFATLCSSESNPGRFIKDITLSQYGQGQSSIEFLHLLLLKCANIEKLRGCSSVNFTQIFQQIRLAYERGACKRIQYVDGGPGFRPESYYQIYLDTMYCLRNSLHDLSMMDNFKVQPHTTHSPLQTLNEFSALRTLNIDMICTETFYFLGKYTENCRKLEKLKLHWHPNIDTNEDVVADVRSLTGCPTIKHLHITKLPVTKKILEFIIHAFPRLGILTIYQSISVQHPHNTIPNNLWVQFLTFLQNIKGGISVGDLYIADISGVLSDYFNTTKSSAHLYISLQGPMSEQPYIKIANIVKKASDQDISIKIQLQAMQDENEPPLSTLLRKMGSVLKSLTFDGTLFYDNEYTLDSSIWDVICQQCPSLENLHLSYTTFKNSNSQRQTNTSIKNITINYCGVSQELFPELSHRLPSLTSLSLINWEFIDNGRRSHRNIIIEMPNTTFDTLACNWYDECFISDDINDCLSDEMFSSFVLRIDTSSKSYCYIGNDDCSVDELSGASYQTSWDDQTVLSFYIQCQDIKKFDIAYDDCSWNIVFTEQ